MAWVGTMLWLMLLTPPTLSPLLCAAAAELWAAQIGAIIEFETKLAPFLGAGESVRVSGSRQQQQQQ